MTLTNSTISGNQAAGNFGGGLFAGNEATVTIESSTIVQNSSATNGGGVAASVTSPTTFNNSIIVGNTGTGEAPDFFTSGTNFSGSYNLLGTGVALTSGSSNQTGQTFASAALGSLADNGGPTQTHALLFDSPAIDAGNSALSTDGRGLVRAVDFEFVDNASGSNASDIGAFELQTTDPLSIPLVVVCLLYTSPSPRDRTRSRMPSSA